MAEKGSSLKNVSTPELKEEVLPKETTSVTVG